MKKLVLIAVLVPFFFACRKNVIKQDAEITVEKGKCVQQTGQTEPFTICLDEIVEDSRCPINANCVWAGVAIARFSFTANAKVHQLTLATNEVRPHTTTDTTIQGYTISLLGVQPYPGSNSTETPTALVRIQNR